MLKRKLKEFKACLLLLDSSWRPLIKILELWGAQQVSSKVQLLTSCVQNNDPYFN